MSISKRPSFSRDPKEISDASSNSPTRTESVFDISQQETGTQSRGAVSKPSLFKRLYHSFRSSSLAFSDFLIAWTPFLLVVTFYIVSTAIFVMSNEEAIKVFYFFFMATNFYISATCVIESFLGLTPVQEARAAAIKVQERGGKWTSSSKDLPIIDLVIVAYLPNEQDIIRDQVLYAVEDLVYPRDRLRIKLVYNTPKPIEPLETELHELAGKTPGLEVIKVPGSKSKADNLNYFLNLDTGADVIGIFDSDHSPHPHNPRWAAERFMADKSVDIVQGRCVVWNTQGSFYAKMIAVEFDKIYAISHPGRSRMYGFGLFCGSNGYWKADLLKGHKMHGEMLTEDIDSALRAYGKGKNAVHDMSKYTVLTDCGEYADWWLDVTSFEMAPTRFSAFWKQRLRWAQGWTQASIVHMKLVWTNPPAGPDGVVKKRSGKERFGVLSLLLVREISYYLVTLHTCLLISFLITNWPHNVHEFVKLIFFRFPMSEWFFFAT